MFADDKQKAAEKEARAQGWATDFFSNPDVAGLALDKPSLNVFLSVWLSEKAISSGAVALRIYEATIRRGLFLLGREIYAAAAATYDLMQKPEPAPTKKRKKEFLLPELVEQIEEQNFLKSIVPNLEKIKGVVLAQHEKTIQKKHLDILKKILDKRTLSLFVDYYTWENLAKDKNAPIFLDETINAIAKEEALISKFTSEIKNGEGTSEERLKFSEKVKMTGLFNALYNLEAPYDRTTNSILQRLYTNYGVFAASEFEGAKGKMYWTKEPKFVLEWQKRRQEMIDYFETKFKETQQKTYNDLLNAYNATLAYFYSSQKVLEFYTLPLAIVQKYPDFVFALDADRYFSEVIFDAIMPKDMFKID